MGLKNMNIKDRIISYEPLFDKWVLDEIIDVYDQESIVRIKDQSYGSNQFAYLKVITIYDQDDDLKCLEQRVERIKSDLEIGLLKSEFIDCEQYLIENNQSDVIGIDLCLLMKNHEYKIENINNLNGELLYELGLKLFDRHEYDEALIYFKKGEEIGNSDCICVIGYLYERGLGVEQSDIMAAHYYQKATDLKNVVASCNLAYFYEMGIGVEQDYQKAYELYLKGAKAGFPRAICNLGYCYEYGYGVEADIYQAVEYYIEAAKLGYSEAI